MHTTYRIPMNRLVPVALLLCVAAISATVAWSFKSGLTWTGICLIVVAGPLALLYWYMLYVNPRRAAITVAEEGILLAAPPFASAVIPWASVEKTFAARLDDPAFSVRKARKFMHFAGYRSGVVELASGREAVIVSNRIDVLCLETAERYYLLGPTDLAQFAESVDQFKQ